MFKALLQNVRKGLLSVGYRQERIRENVRLGEDRQGSIDLLAYADSPFDARTSTIAVVNSNSFPEDELVTLKSSGAPILAVVKDDSVQWWKQSTENPIFLDRVESRKIASFFQRNREELAPESVYRAKVWGRVTKSWQLDFVDVGLLPLVEEVSGERMRELLERAVTETTKALGWNREIQESDGRWLLKSVFWLLAVKILKDKGVHGFKTANLHDLESVYLKLARHYDRDDPRPVQINGSNRRDALLAAADLIEQFGYCGAVTTESLAQVYESALIDRLTRQKLSIHSTPTWLVDEVVAELRPWIEEMPVDDRFVFEPACGHGGFLISAMRLLSELLPDDRFDERKGYLRKRLHGIEIDSFAYEIARLSLTLADVPNDNGWMLENCNMFIDGALEKSVAKSRIVLANPPFGKFGDQRPEAAMHSKADETFRQIAENLPVGGVFGIVMPQNVLKSTQAKELRSRLLDDFEISQITLFADKVFNYGEPETAVILGRRHAEEKRVTIPVRFRRVREERISDYKKSLRPSSEELISIEEIRQQGGILFVPELSNVWESLGGNPKLRDFIEGGQGFQHKGKDNPDLPPGTIRESEVEIKGLKPGFTRWNRDQLTHELPKTVWLNLDDATIRRPLHGTKSGDPQILLNYPPVSREPWRLKALLDKQGHPVTSHFNVLRQLKNHVSLSAFWALMNSPMANAYAYCHTDKRNILVGTMREMPVFNLADADLEPLETAVSNYFTAATGSKPVGRRSRPAISKPGPDLFDEIEPNEQQVEQLKHLHWRVDAEVLGLYKLSEDIERQILDLFQGVRRRGVPYVQDEYIPESLPQIKRLSEMLAITADWPETNRRRCKLIEQDVEGELTSEEKTELGCLEKLADARLELLERQSPSHPDEIEKTVERLKREGKWRN